MTISRRPFRVLLSSEEIRHGRIILETSAAAAALAFLEADGRGAGEIVKVAVLDLETGLQEAFSLGADAEAPGACG
jgi:hypothetical protein